MGESIPARAEHGGGASLNGRRPGVGRARVAARAREALPRQLLSWVIVAQLAAVLVVGLVTVWRFQAYAAVDERPHFDYVLKVAYEQRLPAVGELLRPEVVAIEDKTYPGPPAAPIEGRGLNGQSYEAFQPPLYYVLAAPAAWLGLGDERAALTMVRLLGLALLVATIAVYALLARAVAGRWWRLGLAAGLVVVLWPGVIVRGVTVSNAGLEILLSLAFMLAVWRAVHDRSDRALVAAGALLGLALLTRLTAIYLTPLLLVAVGHRLLTAGPGARRAALVALVAPAILLGPWVTSNLIRFGTPTQNTQARAQQSVYFGVGPEGYDLDLAAMHRQVFTGVLPQEWEADPRTPGLHRASARIGRGSLALAALLALAAVARSRWRGAALLLLAPVVLAVAMINLTWTLAGWNMFIARYLYPTLLPLVLAGVLGARALSGDGRRGPRIASAVVTVAALVVAGVWVYSAGAFYFRDVGGALFGV